MTDDDRSGGSGPCFAHDIVAGHPVDADTWRDVQRFRRAERARLVAARPLSAGDRQAATDALIRALSEVVPFSPGTSLAVYWPIRGEPDLRAWMTKAHEAGVRVLLPVVVEKDAPLEFHGWAPGCAMKRGIWNILVPAESAPATPDTVVSPLVGVDAQLFRLGNGGGYYDRTLAAFAPRPRVIGVGFADCAIETIFPMPWDVPMDTVVLSDGTVRRRA
jgi:5-formyltetrahydrofolate cyclo-ligase